MAPAPGSQVPSMAFATGMQARLPLGPLARGFLTTPQASLDAADWPVAPRPASTPGSRPTPGAALPGTLASPRAGLPPAGCHELVARLHRRFLLSVSSAPELLDAHSSGITSVERQLVVKFGMHAQFVCFRSRPAAVDVATPPPAVRLRPQLPLQQHQAPDLGAIRPDVRLDAGGHLADCGHVDAEQLRAAVERRRNRPAQVRVVPGPHRCSVSNKRSRIELGSGGGSGTAAGDAGLAMIGLVLALLVHGRALGR